MAETFLVSVIIPTYNYAHFIGDAIESVLAQTYRNVEIIVVDDGSTDETKEVVSRFPHVRYIYQANNGVAAARNLGAQSSQGSYLVFLDSDDRLLSHCLETGVSSLEDNPTCAFVSGQWELITDDGKALPPIPSPSVTKDHYRAFLEFNYIGTPGQVMFRRSVFDAVNGFDSFAPGCEDIELYLRIARSYPVHCHDKVVVQHRGHDSNMSSNRAMMLGSMSRVYRWHLEHVQGNPELETLCRQGIELCRKFLMKELKRQRRERLRSNWFVKILLNVRRRIEAALIFRRYKLRRRRGQE